MGKCAGIWVGEDTKSGLKVVSDMRTCLCETGGCVGVERKIES